MIGLENNGPPPRRHRYGKPIPPHRRGYGYAHRKLRKQVLSEEPNCRSCGDPANVLDHIKPMFLGGETVRENGQGLCTPCSRSKSGREGAWARWHVRPGLTRNGRGGDE